MVCRLVRGSMYEMSVSRPKLIRGNLSTAITISTTETAAWILVGKCVCVQAFIWTWIQCRSVNGHGYKTDGSSFEHEDVKISIKKILSFTFLLTLYYSIIFFFSVKMIVTGHKTFFSLSPSSFSIWKVEWKKNRWRQNSFWSKKKKTNRVSHHCSIMGCITHTHTHAHIYYIFSYAFVSSGKNAIFTERLS